MNFIVFPFDNVAGARRLSFYLAAEEWVAKNLPADDYFFTWVVDPTVICGRHQNVPVEVNLPYCADKHINVFRRKSGGGCVYADHGNIMISYITPGRGRAVEDIFKEYTQMVVNRLKTLAIEAYASGRNDILVNGRKISGGAFYRSGDRNISHSTMLFTTDAVNMSNAITPSRAKLASNGVQSVAARIVTLHELYPNLTFDRLRSSLESPGDNDSSTLLTDEDIIAIEQIQLTYDDPARLTAI